ncbi:hypothetical protein DL89DRAFT_259067 [Linderina pennispora]|uniref:Uncharacterized protein n=1 Tax=Linderina pennispora TaxID=61395 RepID=A0A1Y1W2Z1_9FUNG|nr:uncharacterized protein DL89DRAFT_259067 [Linderina pennispora]ORX67817.1 hypothetical protein DL89DRAFT_259067 [Linderina pennispora]
MVGAQHFLCNELRKFPIEEVEFFLPQAGASTDYASERVDCRRVAANGHVAAVVTRGNASLLVLAGVPKRPGAQPAHALVQALPAHIQPGAGAAVYRYRARVDYRRARACPVLVSKRFKSMFRLTPQVRENAAAAFVGIGSSLASAGAPSLAPTMGWLAVAQGQRVKISERIDEDPDLPPQHHLLTGKGKKGVGRSSSVMVRRTVDKEADRSQKSLRNAYTGTNTPEAMDIFSKRPSQYALDADDAERMSSSQPTTPSISEHLSQEFGSDFDRTSWSATPAQHAFLGSRAPTPGGRVSTDSCRTVAVMENVERTRS